MKNTRTVTPARDALIDYIKHLTTEQADKIARELPRLKQLAGIEEDCA